MPTGAPSQNDLRLPLLRSAEFDASRDYDRNYPICIHYDLKWKLKFRENRKKRYSVAATRCESDLVLCPSDYWETELLGRIQRVLNDKDKLPGAKYTFQRGEIAIQ